MFSVDQMPKYLEVYTDSVDGSSTLYIKIPNLFLQRGELFAENAIGTEFIILGSTGDHLVYRSIFEKRLPMKSDPVLPSDIWFSQNDIDRFLIQNPIEINGILICNPTKEYIVMNIL